MIVVVDGTDVHVDVNVSDVGELDDDNDDDDGDGREDDEEEGEGEERLAFQSWGSRSLMALSTSASSGCPMKNNSASAL